MVFRQPLSMRKADADEILKTLKNAMSCIYINDYKNLSFERLYKGAYDLVLHKYGDLLYEGVCQTMQAHLHSKAVLIANTSDDQLLIKLSKIWKEHKNTSKVICDILMYMDR